MTKLSLFRYQFQDNKTDLVKLLNGANQLTDFDVLATLTLGELKTCLHHFVVPPKIISLN